MDETYGVLKNYSILPNDLNLLIRYRLDGTTLHIIDTNNEINTRNLSVIINYLKLSPGHSFYFFINAITQNVEGYNAKKAITLYILRIAKTIYMMEQSKENKNNIASECLEIISNYLIDLDFQNLEPLTITVSEI